MPLPSLSSEAGDPATIVPQLDQRAYAQKDEPDTKILGVMESNYNAAAPIWQSYWAEGDKDMRFKAGDQSVWSQVYGDMGSGKKFNFNRIKRIINMVSGHQRRQRKTTILTPQDNGPEDQQMADDLSGSIQWAYNRDNTYNIISDAFEHACTIGMGLVESWLDYRSDPVNGDLKHRHIPYSSVFMDPNFREYDLSDCSYIWVRRWLTKRQLINLYPDQADFIETLNEGQRDQKFDYMPEARQYSVRGLIPLDEYWYMDTREARCLVDRNTGEAREIGPNVEIFPQLFDAIPDVYESTITKPTVKLAITVGKRVFYNGANPYNIDRYPFTPYFCYFEPGFSDWPNRIQGMVRGLRDSQYLYNRRVQIELDLLESQVNSGEIVKDGFYLTPEDAMKSGNGVIRYANSMANLQLDRMPMMPAQIPPSMMQMSQNLANEIQQISGVSEELLGMAQDDQAGILSMLRQGAGLTTLQKLFDQLDFSQKMMGELDVEIIQRNWHLGKVRRILNREPMKDLFGPYVQKYDVVIEEGALTSTQRQMQALQLFQLKQMGFDVPVNIILQNLNLQGKNELQKALEQQQQAMQQAQMQQAQAEAQKENILAQSIMSKALSDRALAQERLSRVEVEKYQAIENIAQAQQYRTESQLNLIKSAQELEQMPIKNLLGNLQILADIAQRLKVQEQENVYEIAPASIQDLQGVTLD